MPDLRKYIFKRTNRATNPASRIKKPARGGLGMGAGGLFEQVELVIAHHLDALDASIPIGSVDHFRQYSKPLRTDRPHRLTGKVRRCPQ